MNWKLVTVVIISFILIVTCYLTLDMQKYFITKKDSLKEPELDLNTKKIKINISKEEDLKKIKIPDNHVIYYFPSKCPNYKEEFFLTETDEGLDKYYVPEEGYVIIIKKDHKWTKDPDFVYWKLENL